ncbi:MAG: hypothetical protein IJX03_06280 [Clostridia bacterium]|nr:hypothetical protein [Clostridia bacterium]
MEQERTVYTETERSIPVFKILYKNLLLIVMITVLCALIGLGYSVMRVKPTYTATRSVILRTTMNENTSSNLTNEASLAKLYLPNVAKLIKSPDVVNEVNEVYAASANEGEKVKRGAISVYYGEQSFIFSISYTDRSPELAQEKLDVLIETFSNSSKFQAGIQADQAKLIHTQKQSTVTKSNSYVKFTAIGAIAGLVIAVAVVFVMYLLDNTVRDKAEFEELTGVDVIAYINKEKPKKK